MDLTNVFYFYGHTLIFSDYKTPELHKHVAKHMIFSLGNDMECYINGKKLLCRGICIDSNVEHTIKACLQGVLVFLFEETSTLSGQLKNKYLHGKSFSIIDEDIVDTVINIWIDNNDNSREVDKEILMACQLNTPSQQEYDQRIITVLSAIAKAEGIYEDTIEKLCNIVYLSQSRLSHLFSEQVGVSLASFLVLEKMRKTYAYVISGESLTDSAIRAGFNSSSHFSATCKRMFGLSVGASLGGMLAPRTAAFDKRIQRVIAWSIFPNFFDVILFGLSKNQQCIIKWCIKYKMSFLINTVVNKKLKSGDESVKWGFLHGMYAYQAKTPYEYIVKMNKYQMLDIAHKIEQDMLIIGANKDHFIDYHTVGKEIDALTNVRSLTVRIFTEKENAGEHCNVGNPRLCFDAMINWIEQIKKRDNRI